MRSLRIRLTLTYLVLILLAVGILGGFLYQSFRSEYLSEHEISKLIQSRIIADQLVERSALDPQRAVIPLEELSRRFGARLLLLDEDGRVMVDSLGQLNERRLSHAEVGQALRGVEAASFRVLSDGTAAMYVAVPIVRLEGIRGVLFASYPMDDAVEFLADLSRRITQAVLASGLAAAVLSLWLASHLTQPVRRLTGAVRKMAGGDLGARVKVTGFDELGVLAASFNQMGERLQQLDASRRRFIADASHEMRTPLSSMHALTSSLIGRYGEDAALREELEGLDREVMRLSRLVNQLLQLAKLDAGGSLREEEARPVDLGWMAARVVAAYEPLAAEAGVRLRSEVPRGLQVSFGEDALESVIQNLVDNAIKYSSRGGEVEVSAEVLPGAAVLKVADTGAGIPPEALPHIFDRFYRVDKARSRAAGGSGLGLSLVKEYVERYGGRVDVRSCGEGTLFSVTLPIFNTSVTDQRK